MHVERTFTVSAPIEAVFDYLSDFENTEEWDPGTVSTKRTSGDGGLGTTYANTSEFMGRKTELTYETITYDQPTWFQCRGRNKTATATDSMTFTPARRRHADPLPGGLRVPRRDQARRAVGGQAQAQLARRRDDRADPEDFAGALVAGGDGGLELGELVGRDPALGVQLFEHLDPSSAGSQRSARQLTELSIDDLAQRDHPVRGSRRQRRGRHRLVEHERGRRRRTGRPPPGPARPARSGR